MIRNISKFALVVIIFNSCVTHQQSIYKSDTELSPNDLSVWNKSIESYKKRLSSDLKDYRKHLVSNNSTKPVMWRIERQGYKTSYLFGTIHIGISWSSFPLSMKSCVRNAQLAIFETTESARFDSTIRKNIRKQNDIDQQHGLARNAGENAWKNYKNEMTIFRGDFLNSLTPRNARNIFLDSKDNYVRGEQPQLDEEVMGLLNYCSKKVQI